MNGCQNKILELKTVKEIIKNAINTKKIFCIGVDGPTASGKTVFAKILKKEIQKNSDKNIEIIPLDSLLVERSLREKSLKNIRQVGISFEHEAEIHMRFSKFEELLNLITLIRSGLENPRKIILNNLYSRSDKGKCSGRLEINLTNQTILIFEGHYTTRPDFDEVLDYNFILLANRKELIKRKIERVAGYRNKNEVEQYFELIDEPSYLSNYSRFAKKESLIIDNSDFYDPFSVNYFHIKKLLKVSSFFDKKPTNSKYIKEFIFGTHGLSSYTFNIKNNIETLLFDLNNKENLINKEIVSSVLSRHKIQHKIFYFDYASKNNLEIGFVVNLFGKNIFWISRKSSEGIKHLLFWEGGSYKIENDLITRLDYLINEENFSKAIRNDFWENLSEGKCFLSKFLLDENSKKYDYCFLENSYKLSFIASALNYSQFSCKSLGDLFAISFKSNSNQINNKIKHNPKVFNINKLLLSEKRTKYFTKKSSYYLLTDDFLILYKKLNKKIFKELKDIYFTSEDMQIRSSIIEGLLHVDNKHFVKEDFRKCLYFCKGYFPISMSRLYILRKLEYEQSNVLATNIYDISKDPIDSYTYLKTALENSFPIIFQASLNSIGQREKAINGSHNEGYLKPKKGVKDFTQSICDIVVECLNDEKAYSHNPPFFGVGLDHVDVKGNVPIGRSNRFVSEAISTETITHITLDGSEQFKPATKSKIDLYKSYIEVFKASLNFLDKNNTDVIDLEFCTGELNYIGNNKNPHYPDGDEISMLPLCFNASIDSEDILYSTYLSNTLKLYVANLGTTHHGDDKEHLLKINLAEIWQKSLENSNFISPVLHGTTGSSESTFSIASKSCFKINIAGSLLQILLENLTSNQKKILGFNFFDERSKYLCSKFNLIKKDNELINTKQLKKEFLRYCKINMIKRILDKNEKIIRKPLYGRNKIAKTIFAKLEHKLKS